MRRGLRSWLRRMPLQRRVAYLTTVAVALAVAATSVAGYVTLRVSLYRALDDGAGDHRGGAGPRPGGGGPADDRQADRALGAIGRPGGRGRSGPTAARSSCPTTGDRLVLGPDELAVARLGRGFSARSGVSEAGVEYRIVAVPLSELRAQLRAGDRPAAGADQQHPQLAVGGPDHLRGDRGGAWRPSSASPWPGPVCDRCDSCRRPWSRSPRPPS